MKLKARKIALHSLGCKVNAYETEAMGKELSEAGADIVDWEDFADVYIINTCSVTNIADRKSRQMLHRAKLKNPAAVVVGAGCYVQAKYEELKKDTAVDILIGNNQKNGIVSILEAYEREGQTEAETYVQDLSKECAFESMAGGERTEHARAFLKVQDGCNQFCSYCIIPYVRGRIRSRSLEDSVRETELLAGQGYQEIVLTGIHLSSYGLDFDHQNYEYAMNHEIPSEHLLELIRRIAAVPGVKRVRLGSLEPRIITREFVSELKRIPELCPHFHLSLQSGADVTLKSMNRHYDTHAFRESVDILREAWEDVAITTDVIVGFPGETEEDFECSKTFIDQMNFYELHVFKYSRRQGTAADRMPGQLTDRVKTERSQVLIQMDLRKSAAFRERFLGREDEILVEEVVTEEGRQYLTGLNRQYVRFHVPVEAGVDASGEIGRIKRVYGEQICQTYVLARDREIG